MPSAGKVPAGIELTAQGSGPRSAVVYEIKEWLVPKSPEAYKYAVPERSLEPVDVSKARPSVRGSVTNLGPDLRGAAPGTVGAFVLIPK